MERVAVADVVVDGDPAVAHGRDDAAARAAGQARHELADGPLDGSEIVRLDMDRAERAAGADLAHVELEHEVARHLPEAEQLVEAQRVRMAVDQEVRGAARP